MICNKWRKNCIICVNICQIIVNKKTKFLLEVINKKLNYNSLDISYISIIQDKKKVGTKNFS